MRDVYSSMEKMRKTILDECDRVLEREARIHKDRLEDRNRDMYWTNYDYCEFYDKSKGCLAYGYEDCNNTRAHRCKYAKMQAMEKHKGIATSVIFRWAIKSEYGTIEFKEPYLTYAQVQFNNITEYEFNYLYHIFKEKGVLTDEYGQPFDKDYHVSYYRDNY